MKKLMLPSKRDLTGLACAFGMGLLILLAWATVPTSPAPENVQGNLIDKALPRGTPMPPARAGDSMSHLIPSGGH